MITLPPTSPRSIFSDPFHFVMLLSNVPTFAAAAGNGEGDSAGASVGASSTDAALDDADFAAADSPLDSAVGAGTGAGTGAGGGAGAGAGVRAVAGTIAGAVLAAVLGDNAGVLELAASSWALEPAFTFAVGAINRFVCTASLVFWIVPDHVSS